VRQLKRTCALLALLIIVVAACTPAPTPAPTATAPAPAGSTAVPEPQGLPTPTLQAKAPKSEEDLQKIPPEELLALIEGEADLVVVDNQPKGAYDLGHVPGAINFPWAMEIKDPGDLPKDKLLVLYCACQHEEDSTFIAMELINKFGYDKVMLLDGGWLKWTELELPVEEGEGA
jgi:rhodanese-related sulfurtransferase